MGSADAWAKMKILSSRLPHHAGKGAIVSDGGAMVCHSVRKVA
jgi:hypothetical protein